MATSKNRFEVFESVHFEHNAPDGIDKNYWHMARNAIICKLVNGLSDHSNPQILEIGAGRGCVLKYLLEKGKRVNGIEKGLTKPISPDIAAHIRYQTDAFSLTDEEKGGIDIILLADVLEHLDDPRQFLRSCHEHFPGCRYVIATVPAGKDLFSNYDIHYGHKVRYDPESLDEAVGGSGFLIESWGYFFHALRPCARILLSMGRARSTVMRSPHMFSLPLHRCVGKYFLLESMLLPKKMPGTSMWVILQREAFKKNH